MVGLILLGVFSLYFFSLFQHLQNYKMIVNPPRVEVKIFLALTLFKYPAGNKSRNST